MGKVTGFLEIDRVDRNYQPASDRIRHFREFVLAPSDEELIRQAGRCMDCGVPYCHTGCPVNNQIPDWNDLVYQGDWKRAANDLHLTNNFPEFTGRVCPAPCEEACTLNLENIPVTIKSVEQAIADRAFEEGWIRPQPAREKTAKKVAIIGSGPAGMAAAQQLSRAGHKVEVFEREPKAGGLLRYGIPDFKLAKHLVERRVLQLGAEGVTFYYGVNIVTGQAFERLVAKYDAVLISAGAEEPRNPQISGMDLPNVHYAMAYLVQQNRRENHEDIGEEVEITANSKRVVVVGGGDTASDCIGTAFRQGATSVIQLDIRQMPPDQEDKLMVWPYWPVKMRTSSSQAEGAEREFAVAALEFIGKDGRLAHVKCARVDQTRNPLNGSEFYLPVDLGLVAVGFSGPLKGALVDSTRLTKDLKGNIKASTKDYRTSKAGVYAAGDVRRGQSLVVWAIREGREAARQIDLDLMGNSKLP